MFLYFVPFLVFLFPFLPQKLISVGFPLFVFMLSFKLVRERSSLLAITVLTLYFILSSLFYEGTHFFIPTAGIFATLIGFLILIIFKENSIGTVITKKFFLVFTGIGILQIPVNLLLIYFLYEHTTPGRELYIVDICFGTFGYKKTGLLGIYTMLMLFAVTVAFEKYNKKFLYWLLLLVLMIVMILTHAGGAVIIFLAALGLWLILNFKRIEIFKTLAVVILLAVFSVSIFRAVKYVIPEDRKEYMRDFENIFTYALKHFQDNTRGVTNPEHDTPNKLDAIKRAYSFTIEEGNIITGTQAGILRKNFYTGIESIDTSYLTGKVFPGIRGNYTNGISTTLGESGILGLTVLLAVFLYLCYGSFIQSKIRNKKIKVCLILIFIAYNFYRFSFLDYQFTFLWAFLYFNIDRISDADLSSFLNKKKNP